MDFILSAARKDLQRRLRDPWSIVMWVVVPLLIGSLITSISGGGATPTAQLLLVDEDDSFISRLVASAFSQGELADLVQVQTVGLDEGMATLDAGDASALLQIPAGFSAAVLADEATTLTLLTNPSQRILPAIIEETLGVMLDGAFYLQRIFGEQIQTINTAIQDDEAPNDLLVAQLSVSINQSIVGLTQFALPPALELEASAGEQSGLNFAFLFFPGVLFMAVLFTARGMTEDQWHEREQGTLRRLAASPASLVEFVVAKILTCGVVIAAVVLPLLLLGFAYHGVSFAKIPGSLAWLVLAGLLLYALLALIQLYAPSRSVGDVLTTMLMFPLLMAGGSFFPLEAMPEWFAAVGRWTPNGLMLSRLMGYLQDRHVLQDLFVTAALVALMTTLLLVWAGRRTRRIAATP